MIVQREGEGKFIDAQGNIYSGTWVRDLMDGKFDIIFITGGSFSGFYARGQVL